MPPVHASLFASSGHVSATGGLNIAGSNVQAMFSKKGVAHGQRAFFEIGEFLEGRSGIAECMAVCVVQSPDEGECAMPKQEAFKLAVLLVYGVSGKMEFEA